MPTILNTKFVLQPRWSWISFRQHRHLLQAVGYITIRSEWNNFNKIILLQNCASNCWWDLLSFSEPLGALKVALIQRRHQDIWTPPASHRYHPFENSSESDGSREPDDSSESDGPS